MFINPFTLLIIPLLGSLLILIYPSSDYLGLEAKVNPSFSKLTLKNFSTAYGLAKFSSSPTPTPTPTQEIVPIKENINQNLY
jgi:hypothetical protein